MVALAFLLSTGFISDLQALDQFLEQHEVTITGGLNLYRAPWNNTTLRSMIAMIECMRKNPSYQYGGIHGNGSLGYQQGFTILEAQRA